MSNESLASISAPLNLLGPMYRFHVDKTMRLQRHASGIVTSFRCINSVGVCAEKGFEILAADDGVSLLRKRADSLKLRSGCTRSQW